jgi:cysteinyl-tRNA synthetase
MKVYNTLTRSKDDLVPMTPGEIRMYVCGVTVYDLCHIGHARSAIVFDVIVRYLRHRGYRVTFVKNFTDVDDKIIRRANEEGVDARVVSERYVEEFRVDMAAIGVLPGDIEPKATEHIPEMLVLIERLIAGGMAYVVDGDVYFEVRRYPPYGKLSGKNLDDLMVGARVDVDERKRDPRDFALWKAAKPGEPSWDSPWGPGRPGWHIECSAMAMQYLGESFDLHGGGEDLIFPHHECEIAQAEAATRRPFARVWVHNGFVNLRAEKMSKSLGNTLNIREIVKRHDAEALRLWLLGTHYRHPVEYAEERLQESARALDRLRRLAAAAPDEGGSIPDDPDVRPYVERFYEAMDDDFNTPGAVAVLFDLSRELQRVPDPDRAAPSFRRGVATLRSLARALGLLERTVTAAGPSAETEARIVALVSERDEARRSRNWKRSDELRAELANLGVTVEDTPSGSRWTWKGA